MKRCNRIPHVGFLVATTFLLAFLLAGCGNSDKSTQPSTLAMESGTLELAIMQHSYSVTVEASGGKLNYEFELDHDLLPPGIVAEWVDNDLVFHGNATAAGSFSIPVDVIDADRNRASATFVINVAADNNVAGNWSMVITVTQATGSCAGEEGTDPPESITITQVGANLSVTGFLGNPSNVATGSIGGDNGNVVTISGTWAEDGGVTNATHVWTMTSPTSMSGDEIWSWTDGTDSCPGSHSTVVCSKSGP